MNDCPSAEFRDMLPDLLHERLDASERARALAHIESCDDCLAELSLLRELHGSFVATTPRIDTVRVAAAIEPRMVQTRARHRRMVPWQVAAAVTVLAVGGGSMAVLRRDHAVVSAIDSASTIAAVNAESAALTPVERAAVDAPESSSPGIAMTGRLNELSERELQALLNDIEQLQAIPIVDPEPVGMTVTPRPSTPEGT